MAEKEEKKILYVCPHCRYSIREGDSQIAIGPFWVCHGCGNVFVPGGHLEQMKKKIKRNMILTLSDVYN